MDTFVIAKTFSSRLIVGTAVVAVGDGEAHEASGADMITVAVRA